MYIASDDCADYLRLCSVNGIHRYQHSHDKLHMPRTRVTAKVATVLKVLLNPHLVSICKPSES